MRKLIDDLEAKLKIKDEALNNKVKGLENNIREREGRIRELENTISSNNTRINQLEIQLKLGNEDKNRLSRDLERIKEL